MTVAGDFGPKSSASIHYTDVFLYTFQAKPQERLKSKSIKKETEYD